MMREQHWQSILPPNFRSQCVAITAERGNNGNIVFKATALGKEKQLELHRFFSAKDTKKAVALAWAIALNCKCPDDLTNFRKAGNFMELDLPYIVQQYREGLI